MLHGRPPHRNSSKLAIPRGSSFHGTRGAVGQRLFSGPPGLLLKRLCSMSTLNGTVKSLVVNTSLTAKQAQLLNPAQASVSAKLASVGARVLGQPLARAAEPT